MARTILVVDDHVDTLRIMTKLLRGSGYKVLPAASCAEARSVAEASGWKFDLLLCDVGLPDGDGADVLAEFKQRCGCVTIALTGFASDGDLARYEQKHIDRCLIKPVTIEQLRQAIEG